MKERVVFTGRECRLLGSFGQTVSRVWLRSLAEADRAAAIYAAAETFSVDDFADLKERARV